MDLMPEIKARRSVRQYQPEALSEEQILLTLEAARLAPSWKNKQCAQFVVIREREKLLRLGALLRYNPSQNAYENAACFLVLCAHPAQSGNRDGKPYYLTDAAAAMDHLMLQAQSMGLGTCWVGVFPEGEVKALLGIPDGLRVVGLTPLGVPAEQPEERPRKPLSETVHWEQW